MAKASRKRKKSSGRRRHHTKRNAGSSYARMRTRTRTVVVRKPSHRRSARRHNAGGMGNVLVNGAGVLVGVVGSKVGTQAILGTKNTGVMGYAVNLATGGALAWAASKFMHGYRELPAMIMAGTVAQVISRAIGDYSLLGQYSSQLGLGDYMVANWVSPQILPDALHSPMVSQPSGWGAPPPALQSAGAGAAGGTGMGSYDSLY